MSSGLPPRIALELGWAGLGGTVRQLELHATELGEMRMDATAQALASSHGLLGFDGRAEDCAGFLLHGSAVARGLDAELRLGVLIEVPDREGGHGDASQR